MGSDNLKDCMNCLNIKTRKEYDLNANSYRVNYCDVFGKDLVWDDELKIHSEANGCNAYIDYGLIHESE